MPWFGGEFSASDFAASDFDAGRFAADAPAAPCGASAATDICPTLEDCHAQILAALPRGRAWDTPFGSVRWRFFRAFAEMVAWANERICAARDEFFCASMNETADVWAATYGFPDGCDPYARVCDKVAAVGGQTCAYLVEMAARAGYSIECVDLHGAEADCAEAGCGEAAPPYAVEGMLGLRVDMSRSPAIGTLQGTSVEASLYEASQPIICGSDIAGLQCLMDRIAPAHLKIVYIVQ